MKRLEEIRQKVEKVKRIVSTHPSGADKATLYVEDSDWLLACLDELANAETALCDGIAGLPPLTAIAGVLTEEYEAMRAAVAKLRE